MPESPAPRPARDGLRITGVRTIVTVPPDPALVVMGSTRPTPPVRAGLFR